MRPLHSATSLEMAAKVLFRVLDTEANQSTLHWDDLPVLARNAVQDLHWSEPSCLELQARAIDAFRAVGYPQELDVPCPVCPPYQECPPCCPPDYCCGVVEE